MLQSEMEDILTVLAVGIFADKKIHSSEIRVFIQSVSRLKLSNREMPTLSEAKALTWFEMNRDAVRAKFSGPRSEFDAWIVANLKRVGEHADRDVMLHLLTKIFWADNEVHNSEAAFMALIQRVWDLQDA